MSLNVHSLKLFCLISSVEYLNISADKIIQNRQIKLRFKLLARGYLFSHCLEPREIIIFLLDNSMMFFVL